jgi:PhnB protein
LPRLFAGAPLKASDADAGGLEQWFSTWKGPLGFTLEELDVSVSGDVAFATALTHLSGEKHDGQKAALWYRLTLGLTRTDRGWKIAHQHESVPFYMDGSFKAAIDLDPRSEVDWQAPSRPPISTWRMQMRRRPSMSALSAPRRRTANMPRMESASSTAT